MIRKYPKSLFCIFAHEAVAEPLITVKSKRNAEVFVAANKLFAPSRDCHFAEYVFQLFDDDDWRWFSEFVSYCLR
jgi:hypothetical protein